MLQVIIDQFEQLPREHHDWYVATMAAQGPHTDLSPEGNAAYEQKQSAAKLAETRALDIPLFNKFRELKAEEYTHHTKIAELTKLIKADYVQLEPHLNPNSTHQQWNQFMEWYLAQGELHTAA
jgi:hypothetical protein